MLKQHRSFYDHVAIGSVGMEVCLSIRAFGCLALVLVSVWVSVPLQLAVSVWFYLGDKAYRNFSQSARRLRTNIEHVAVGSVEMEVRLVMRAFGRLDLALILVLAFRTAFANSSHSLRRCQISIA
jgi:hypothetical protein